MALQKDDAREKIRIMFVCLGNICRSPLAEGVFREEVRRAGVEDAFEIHSSGTGHWHVGGPADERMREIARRKGVSLEAHRARQFSEEDLDAYDYIFVMDKDNLHDVLFLDRNDRYGHKVRLFRELDTDPGDYQVPDPYFGGEEGFETVYEIVRRTARQLITRLVEEHEIEVRTGSPE